MTGNTLTVVTRFKLPFREAHRRHTMRMIDAHLEEFALKILAAQEGHITISSLAHLAQDRVFLPAQHRRPCTRHPNCERCLHGPGPAHADR